MKLIHITKGKTVKVDEEDYDTLMKWKWTCKIGAYTFYAMRAEVIGGKSVEIKMHRQIMDVVFDKATLIDHRDGDGLNNQRENLRKCNRSQNNINTRKRKNSTSIYKGVSYQASTKALKKWIAFVSSDKKHYFLGRYDTEIEAAIAYDRKALELHGEFAVLNIDAATLKQ